MNGIQMTVRWRGAKPGSGYEMLCIGFGGEEYYAPLDAEEIDSQLEAGGQVFFAPSRAAA